jgi:hypothetical protein
MLTFTVCQLLCCYIPFRPHPQGHPRAVGVEWKSSSAPCSSSLTNLDSSFSDLFGVICVCCLSELLGLEGLSCISSVAACRQESLKMIFTCVYIVHTGLWLGDISYLKAHCRLILIVACYRIARQCFGTWMMVNIFTLWTTMISSLLCVSHQTDIGYVLHLDPPSKFG